MYIHMPSKALGDWDAAYGRASIFVYLCQKLALIPGSSVNSTHSTFDTLKFLDGDMGLQDYYYVSAWSLSNALAMTGDEEAIYAQAKVVSTEYYQKGLQVPLGPAAQPLGRTSWGVRNANVDAGVPCSKGQETNRTGWMRSMDGGTGDPGGGGPGNSNSSFGNSRKMNTIS
ncbi:hypothetical protein BDV29DRAFT_161206 [Aspergillus leporis]|uniref:Uncharacterized protein n=1 Tax=Aspergillus leporis TaxID=41062 RepID=A0A5N5WMA9_9EURO|nr:hypothetical protein BDV29DRAFT_161206 [Aspergillus leporis]